MAVAVMKHVASNFVKLDKFEGVDFRRWQKKMHFLLSSISVVYVLTTPMPEDGVDNPTMEQVRKRAKCHLRIEESLRVQDSDKPKGNNVVGPLVVNMVEHNNSSMYNNNKGTKGSVDVSSNSLKGRNMFNKSLQVYYVTYVSEVYFVQDDDIAWDVIFDENRFSLVPRLSQRSLKDRAKDIGGSVVPEKNVTLWKEAINDDMDSIMGNNTWVLVDLPSGIYYFDNYAPVACISTIRLLIAMASIHNLIIHQMDVKKTFFNGKLKEEQVPKQWHQKFDEVVLSNGYLLNQANKCVYSKFDKSCKGVIIFLYVDDMLIFSTDQVQVDLTKEFLSSRFSIKDMGEADVILDCGDLSKAYQFQPPQCTVNHLIFNAHNDLLDSQNKLMEQMTSMCEMVGQLIQKNQEKQIQEDQAANARYWKIPAYYDDDDDYNFAITPNETVDSLIMGDEHLDTIPATKSNEFIKSCVENLVPNPSESEGKNGSDLPACFTTFLNILFDAEYEFDSVDDQSKRNQESDSEAKCNEEHHVFFTNKSLKTTLLNVSA
nr:zinc finger, CCHC-type [Tanacetum cinerariifolium]